MRVMKRRGFTIIETMLFLAISGVLTVAIMVGAGMSIGSQRYKDAVATLQSDIQQQYEDAVSIKNGRGASDTIPSGCVGDRGQTDCILMGKLMTITGNGRVTQYVVYGSEPTPPLSETITNEYTVMRAYVPSVVASSAQETTMEWGTGIAWPEAGSGARPVGTNRDIAILVIRSPRTGIVYTFTRDDASQANLVSMINSAQRNRRTICVAPTGWVISDRMSVSVAAGASSANAVEVGTNQMTSPGLSC